MALALLLALAGCGEGEGPPPEAADTTGVPAQMAPPAGEGEVHLVRVVARAGRHAFEPDELRVRPGDVVRFVLTGAQPDAVAFDTTGAPAGGADFLRAGNLLRGPLLTTAGQVYDVSFRGAPPGRYAFRSLAHGALGMRGVVVVE